MQGMFRKGMLADLVVLSKDIFKIPPYEILQTKILLTVMSGKDTYRDKNF